MCYGSSCDATFTNVHFTDCPVLVLAGAHVTFQSCTFTCTSQPTAPPAKVAAASEDESCWCSASYPFAALSHGDGTVLTAVGCDFQCSSLLHNGLVVLSKAHATVKSTSLSGATHAAVSACGQNTHLEIESCCSMDSNLRQTQTARQNSIRG